MAFDLVLAALQSSLPAAAFALAADGLAQRQCRSFACAFKNLREQHGFECNAGHSADCAGYGVQLQLCLLLRLLLCLMFLLPVGLLALLCGLNLAAAAVCCILAAGVFYAVNLLKFKVLHEPLVFTDLLLIKEIVSCPRFYFGYITLKQRIVLLLLFCALAATGLSFEPSRNLYSCGSFVSAYFYFAALTLCLLLLYLAGSLKALGRAGAGLSAVLMRFYEADSCLGAARFGVLLHFVLGLALYLLKAQWPECLAAHERRCRAVKGCAQETAGSIVLIQAESLIPGVKDLAEAACGAQFSSELKLSYFGAYTMRTEFAVLTGIEPQQLGACSSDPYLLAASQKISSLASRLKLQGYYSICLHANSGRFFNRRQVMAGFGFDECVFAEELKTGNRSASDLEILKQAARRLRRAHEQGSKLFIFIITLGGHGPYQDQSRPEADAIEVYARKQQSLISGLKLLKSTLGGSDSLLVYGDHLPPIESLLKDSAGFKTADAVPGPAVLGFNFRPGAVLQQVVQNSERKVRISCSELNALLLSQGGLYA